MQRVKIFKGNQDYKSAKENNSTLNWKCISDWHNYIKLWWLCLQESPQEKAVKKCYILCRGPISGGLGILYPFKGELRGKNDVILVGWPTLID